MKPAALLLPAALLIPGVAAVLRQDAPPKHGPPPKAEEMRPMAYFTAHCQRCHGPEGSRYPDLTDRSDAQLEESIEEMAEGPGGAPLTPEGLALQVAYHRAIRAGEPFVQIAGFEGDRAVGYASPGATLEYQGDRGYKALVKPDDKGTFRVPSAVSAYVVATKGGKTAKVPIDRAGTSHPAPKGP